MTFAYMPYWKEVDAKVEGASQRIQEDCMNFARIVESIGLQIIRAFMLLIAFIPILWGLSSNVILPWLKDISGSLVYVSLTASLGGVLISWLVGIKLPGLEYNNQVVEAALRKELVYGEDNRADGGSRVIRLSQIDGRTTAEEVWATNRRRVHFSNAIRIGELVIGSSGDFGPAFLVAMDVATGEEVWRERRFARAHMVYADGKLVIIDEDGDLAIASVGDQGLEVHAQAPILTENAWTPPTLVGTTLYVRDRRNILAFDLGR